MGALAEPRHRPSPAQVASPRAETRLLLYALFGQFGKVVDVVALRTERLRGQAWVVYADLAAATGALRALQGFPFWVCLFCVACIPRLLLWHSLLY